MVCCRTTRLKGLKTKQKRCYYFQGNIEQKVNQYCNDLPILQSTCKQIVDKYLDEIIQYLKDGQDQTYICNKVGEKQKAYQRLWFQIGGFCQEASNIAVQKAFVAHVKGQTKGVTCDICEKVAEWIVDFGVNKGIDEIEKYVDGKCDDVSNAQLASIATEPSCSCHSSAARAKTS